MFFLLYQQHMKSLTAFKAVIIRMIEYNSHLLSFSFKALITHIQNNLYIETKKTKKKFLRLMIIAITKNFFSFSSFSLIFLIHIIYPSAFSLPCPINFFFVDFNVRWFTDWASLFRFLIEDFS